MENKYEKLLKEMPKIAEVVKQLPENLQKEAFDRLVSELTGNTSAIPVQQPAPVKKQEIQPTQKSSQGTSEVNLQGICTVRNGDYHFTVRDLKAKNAKDAAKRLVYVLIYSYMKSMNTVEASRKELINPHLESWRLNNGNTRGLISSDPGILKNGDNYSLDIHSENEAQDFIREIKDPGVVGSWKPGATRKKRKKSDDK